MAFQANDAGTKGDEKGSLNEDSHTKAVYIKRNPGKYVGLGNFPALFLHIFAILVESSAKSTVDVRSIVFSQSVLSDSPSSSGFNK